MNPFKGRHFQRDIILWAVRWYCKYGISYRELQEMLAERGVNVNHSTIYRGVQRYAPEMEKRLRWYWRNPSGFCSWHLDETYIRVNGRWGRLCDRGRTQKDGHFNRRHPGVPTRPRSENPTLLYAGSSPLNAVLYFLEHGSADQ